MNSTKTILSGVTLFIAGLLVGNIDIANVTAQEAYPTEHKGNGVAKLGIVPEKSMIRQTGLEGYFLQLRLATLEPEGKIARHKHDTRHFVIIR